MAMILFKGTPWYVHVSFIVAMALVLGGFCVPPMGDISGSVLTAVGELLGGVTLVEFVINIPTYLEAGIKAKISHGATTVEVTSDEDDKEEEGNV